MEKKLPEAPHVGTMLNRHMRQHRYYKSALARDIGVRYETVVDFMRKPDNKVSHLWRICFALNYNFFYDLAILLPPTMRSTPTPKDARIAELEQQVAKLTAERDNLRQVIDILREK